MGRVGVDFYPTTHGSIVEVRQFDKFLGGSPTNVAVAAARLGERAAVITRTGPDPLGEYVHVSAAIPGRRRPLRHLGRGPANAGDLLRDLPA